MVCINDTVNIEDVVAFPTNEGMHCSSTWGANKGINVLSIAPTNPGNLAILSIKKLDHAEK